MIDLNALAKSRAQATGEFEGEWLKVLEWSSQTEVGNCLTDGEFTRLISFSDTISIYKTAFEYFEDHRQNGEQPPALDLLIEHVDPSRFHLGDWLGAVEAMHGWLKKNKDSATFKRILGYIQCCEMSLKSVPEGELSKTVVEMLESHGLEKF